MSKWTEVDVLRANINTAFWSEIGKIIDSSPSIEIVRCKECKKAHLTYDGECKYCDEWKDDDGNYIEVYHDGNHYCSYGERRGRLHDPDLCDFCKFINKHWYEKCDTCKHKSKDEPQTERSDKDV